MPNFVDNFRFVQIFNLNFLGAVELSRTNKIISRSNRIINISSSRKLSKIIKIKDRIYEIIMIIKITNKIINEYVQKKKKIRKKISLTAAPFFFHGENRQRGRFEFHMTRNILFSFVALKYSYLLCC